ncbi:MAG: alpha/beta hydrolase [Myxococcota bacterium]
MRMTTSPLIYRDYAPRRGNAIVSVVALHGEGGDLRQLARLCSNLDARCRIVVPQAELACVQSEREETPAPHGYRWYETDVLQRPEPESFERALYHAEQFVRDVMERRSPGEFRPLLLGYGQGAVLAMGVAHALSEVLTGVIAISGALWGPATAKLRGELTGLPTLLVHDPADARVPRTRVRATLELLKTRGALAELCELEGVGGDPERASALLRRWTDECLASTFRTDFNWEIGL